MKTFTTSVLLSSILLSTTAFASAFPLEAPKDIDTFVTAGTSVSSTSTAAFVAPLDAPKDIIAAGSFTASTQVTSNVVFPLLAPKDVENDYAVSAPNLTKSTIVVADNNTGFVSPLDAPKDRIDQAYSASHQQALAFNGSHFVAPLDAPKDVIDGQSTSVKASSTGYVFVSPLDAPKDKTSV